MKPHSKPASIVCVMYVCAGVIFNGGIRFASSEHLIPWITSVWTDENIIFIVINIVHTT